MGSSPTADAIDRRIRFSNDANGRRSKLTGMGQTFLELGNEYGVNPGIITAILQRESQMGADGSYMPEVMHNFAGITGSGDGGTEFYRDRNWAVYFSPAAGLRAVFALLDSRLYRDTGGWMDKVMDLYSPEGDSNPRIELWNTFHAVADQIGITIEPETNIYVAEGAASMRADVLDSVVRSYTGVAYVWGGIPQAFQDPWGTGWDWSGMTHWVDQKHGDGRLVMGSHYQYAQMISE